MIYITVGISGSGKSFLAAAMKTTMEITEINADNIRKEFPIVVFGDYEFHVWKKVELLLIESVLKKENVILSNTNLKIADVKKIIEKYPNEKIVIVKMLKSKDPEFCWSMIQQDLEKGKDRANVPYEVLQKQFQRFKDFDFESLSCYENVEVVSDCDILEKI